MKKVIFTCPQVPVLQNCVYDNQAAAKSAPTGELEICFEDNFGWNSKFDPDLMKYDKQYDNAVPSSQFESYYDRIADYLAANYDIETGPLIDVGCGQGTFLKRMAGHYDIKGVGIDPSYDGPKEIGNIQFISEEFDGRHVQSEPSLILCRHTLEHIPNPERFLKAIFKQLPRNTKTPVFCEVPDLDWIIEQESWWDFCYEHVNYFNAESFKNCLQAAGCKHVKVTHEFYGQYLWAEGIFDPDTQADQLNLEAIPSVKSLNEPIRESLERIKEISRGKQLVIWGMATKGVMYALHAQRLGITVSCGVDINVAKQGKYAPVSGLRICAPEDLVQGKPYVVVCMNPNYTNEIQQHLESLNHDFVLLEP